MWTCFFFQLTVLSKLLSHHERFFFLGDPDENVYVIQSGKVNVFITGADGSTISLKCVKTGESVTSLLSFTDVLTVSKSTRGNYL